MLAGDIALLGFDQPFTCCGLGDIGGAASPDNSGTARTGTGGQCLGDARWVGMSVLRRMQRPHDTFQIIEWMMRANGIRPDHFDGKTKRAANTHRMA